MTMSVIEGVRNIWPHGYFTGILLKLKVNSMVGAIVIAMYLYGFKHIPEVQLSMALSGHFMSILW